MNEELHDPSSHKTYQTRQKQAIIACVENMGAPCSANDIYRNLQETGQSVGLTTIYRHLAQLVKSGEVRQVWTEKGISSARFAPTPKHDNATIELYCERCGRLEHFQCGAFDELSAHFREAHHFLLDLNHLVLRGLCETCCGVNPNPRLDEPCADPHS